MAIKSFNSEMISQLGHQTLKGIKYILEKFFWILSIG